MRNSSASSRPARRAFTLLELLVAITLVTIVTFSLFASLQIGFRAKARAEAAVEPGRTAELTIELLRADIESSLPPNGILAGEFIGTDSQDERGLASDDLVFYTNSEVTDRGQSIGDTKRVELLVLPESDLLPQNQPGLSGMNGRLPPAPNARPQAGPMQYVLVRRVWTNLLAPVEQDPDEEVLCRGVLSFNLRFYDGTDWLDYWDSTQMENILPVAVQVYMELERPGHNPAVGEIPLKYLRTFLLSAYAPPDDTAADAGTGGTGGTGTGGAAGGGTGGGGSGGGSKGGSSR